MSYEFGVIKLEKVHAFFLYMKRVCTDECMHVNTLNVTHTLGKLSVVHFLFANMICFNKPKDTGLRVTQEDVLQDHHK